MCAWKTLGAAAIGLAHSGAALADGYSGPARYAQPYNWSGAYVGINAGEMSGDINRVTRIVSSAFRAA